MRRAECVQTEVTFTALCARRHSTAAITATLNDMNRNNTTCYKDSANIYQQLNYEYAEYHRGALWVIPVCLNGKINSSIGLSQQHKGDVTKQLFPFLITPTVKDSLTAADRLLVTGFLTKLKR